MSFFKWLFGLFKSDSKPVEHVATECEEGNILFLSQRKLSDSKLRYMMQQIIDSQAEVQQFMGVPSERPVHVRLFKTRSAYREYCQQYVPGFKPEMDFCCWTPSKVSIIHGYEMPSFRLQPRLRHEFVHALYHGRVPLYLEEGWAEFMEGGLQTKRLRAIGRLVRDDFTILPEEGHPPSRRSVYKGSHWYNVGYALALYYHRQGRLRAVLTGLDDGAILRCRFRQWTETPSEWKETQTVEKQGDWEPMPSGVNDGLPTQA